MIGIYKITNPKRRVYIGQSVNIEKRWNKYKNLNCPEQPKLYRSLKKYGPDKHKFEILTQCLLEELNEMERYYQDLYSANSEAGLNCTLTAASDRPVIVSKETREKMSRNTAANRVGKKHSTATRKKLFDLAQTKRNNPVFSKKMSQSAWMAKIILNLETGIYYNNLFEASNAIGTNRATLCRSLNRKIVRKTSFIYV